MGEQLTGSFEEINDVYGQLAWYSFPCEAEQMLIILMGMAQKPVQLRVFGSISCGRVALKNVCKASRTEHNRILCKSFTFV